MSAGPGWYPNPDGDGSLRYWDGQGWTAHVERQTPTASAPVPAPAEMAPAPAPVPPAPTAAVPPQHVPAGAVGQARILSARPKRRPAAVAGVVVALVAAAAAAAAVVVVTRGGPEPVRIAGGEYVPRYLVRWCMTDTKAGSKAAAERCDDVASLFAVFASTDDESVGLLMYSGIGHDGEWTLLVQKESIVETDAGVRLEDGDPIDSAEAETAWKCVLDLRDDGDGTLRASADLGADCRLSDGSRPEFADGDRRFVAVAADTELTTLGEHDDLLRRVVDGAKGLSASERDCLTEELSTGEAVGGLPLALDDSGEPSYPFDSVHEDLFKGAFVTALRSCDVSDLRGRQSNALDDALIAALR